MSWVGGHVYVCKDNFADYLGRPWSVWVMDKHGDPVVQASFDTGTVAMHWAGFLANPALTFAAVWDEGNKVGFGPIGPFLYGPPTNPYRTIAKRLERQ